MKRLTAGVRAAIAFMALTSMGIIATANTAVAQGHEKDKKPAPGPAPHATAPAPRATMPAPRPAAPSVARPPVARAPVQHPPVARAPVQHPPVARAPVQHPTAQHPATVQRNRPPAPAMVQRTPEKRAVEQQRTQLNAQVRGQQLKEQQLRERHTQPLSQQPAPSVSQQVPQQLKGKHPPQVAGKQGQGAVQHVANVRATDKQRRDVQQRIFSDRHVQRIAHGRLNVPLTVGARIPRHLHLHRFAPALLALAPLYAGYSYFVSDDDTICVVDPETYTIVDVIPASVREAGPARPALALSAEQRQCIYATVPRDEARIDVRIRLALGAEIPRRVRLFEFPEPALGCSSQLADFRYVVVDNDVVIVDPASYEIEAVITG
jgi:Protein of unknown function (DUF1236)